MNRRNLFKSLIGLSLAPLANPILKSIAQETKKEAPSKYDNTAAILRNSTTQSIEPFYIYQKWTPNGYEFAGMETISQAREREKQNKK